MNHHVPCTRQSTCETMACPRSYGLVHIEGQRMALICEPDVGDIDGEEYGSTLARGAQPMGKIGLKLVMVLDVRSRSDRTRGLLSRCFVPIFSLIRPRTCSGCKVSHGLETVVNSEMSAIRVSCDARG